MEFVLLVLALALIWVAVELYFHRREVKRIAFQRLEALALRAYLFSIRHKDETERKTLLALPRESVLTIARHLSKANIITTLAEGCVDTDVQVSVAEIAETSRRTSRRALTAKVQRTRR